MKEKMKEKTNGHENIQSWFGYFGFSTNLLSNNFETFFSLGLLILKMQLIRILIRCFEPLLASALGLKFTRVQVFIAEVIPATPFLIIPALTNLLNFKVRNFSEKANLMGQIVTLFFCIICLFLNRIVKTSRSPKKWRRKK